MTDIFLKRIYEPFEQADGYRILVDRLWPRGIAKEDAKLTCWLKDAAPSSELRKWFGHRPERFDEFRSKYLEELQNHELQSQSVEQLHEMVLKHKITLLYAAKDPICNHARVLREELIRRIRI